MSPRPNLVPRRESPYGPLEPELRSACEGIEETALEMSTQESDLECLLRVQSGDSRALADLYDRHTPLLYSLALRIVRDAAEAEEVLQEAWLQVWKSASSYDPRRGTVTGWLVTLARSRALDRYRSMASRKRAEGRPEVEAGAAPPDPAASPQQRQLNERVNVALGGLDPQQREVLQLAYFGGLSQSEIAARLGAPLGTVKSWTRQALIRLREMLPQEEWA